MTSSSSSVFTDKVMIVSRSPPMGIVEGQEWYNTTDHKIYGASIREKMWICSQFDQSIQRTIIRMPIGTRYIDLEHGNEYELGSMAWKVIGFHKRIFNSPIINRSNASSNSVENLEK